MKHTIQPIQPHFVSMTIQAAEILLTPLTLKRAQEVHESWMLQVNAQEANLVTQLNQIREQKRSLTRSLLLVKKKTRSLLLVKNMISTKDSPNKTAKQ